MGQLYDITPFTQLDFPGELACIAWFSGCNLRCAYCHNPDVVLRRGQKQDSDLISFLKSRHGRLTGVVFSGGEATFAPALPALARQAKEIGYKTKLDTNGTNPEVVRAVVASRDIDYIALDYKAPPHRCQNLLGTSLYNEAFRETLIYVIEESHRNHIQLEIRTTCHGDYLDEDDLGEIIEDLDRHNYRGTYWLQNIVTSGDKTLGKVPAANAHIDLECLPTPRNFSLGFRNFSMHTELVKMRSKIGV